MTEANDYLGYPVSLRKQVFALLDKDPNLTPLLICKVLKYPFHKTEQTIANYKQDWKHTHQNERGSMCSSFHCVRWGLWERVLLDRGLALVGGWVESRARNRFLQFKCGLGRVVWFVNGTVRLHVRRPGNEGRAKQLFCDAFFRSGLISDVNVLDKFLGSMFLDSFHTVVDSGRRLPYVKVKDFYGTNGFIAVSGDRSHPTCWEFIIKYQDQFERAKHLFEDLAKSLETAGLVPNGHDAANVDRKNMGVV